jgi:chemotaxis protein MotB
MVVELPENVLFDSGRSELREAANGTLERVAEVLGHVPNRNFLVAGHTDDIPVGRRSRYDSNWELSAARGVSVVRFLAEHGMAAERLAAAGYAETQPVAANTTDEGRAQNRRIEIIVLPNLDELPDLSGLETELAGSVGGS